MTLYEQWLTLFTMGVCGVLMGVFYDGLRELTRAWPALRRWQTGLDVLFWFGSLLLVAAVVQTVNQGVFRWHGLLGLLAGAGVYGKLFSGGIRAFFRRFYRLLAAVASGLVRFVHRFLFSPLLFVARGLLRGGRFFLRELAGIYDLVANIMKRKGKGKRQ